MKWCFLESQEWVGSEFMRYDPEMCADEDPPAICETEDFDENGVDPAYESVIWLYDRSLYCNECFLKIWRQRLLSPFLTSGTWTQFLIDQFDVLQNNCSTSMPYTRSKQTLLLSKAIGTPISTTSGAVTTGVAATTTCTGRVIRPSVTPQYCNRLVDLYKVSSGDLEVITKDAGCEFKGAICIPLPCVGSSFIPLTKYSLSCTYARFRKSVSSKPTPRLARTLQRSYQT
jgi:hypothetical protein